MRVGAGSGHNIDRWEISYAFGLREFKAAQELRGVPLRRALWNAKLSVKKEINAHPAYWAGFQLFGNRNRLQRFNTFNP
ncbi:MAG: hypothetical protein HQ591_07140 [candidate division Zixibacteria bacterium]|nr:hypothetical protein [Candidatus Tariuqbacter arcticus]